MSLETQLNNPNGTLTCLADVTIGKEIKYWSSVYGVWVSPESNQVTGANYNGFPLVQQPDLDAVIATSGTWYWDGADNNLWVNTSGSPVTGDVQGFYTLRFSNREYIDPSGNYYEPRIANLPDLSLDLPTRFSDYGGNNGGGVVQIGGGTLTLAANDDFFDSYTNYQWDAGQTTLTVGYDTPTNEMPFADYQTIGTWLNFGHSNTDSDFQLELQEIKSRIDKQIPFNLYDKDTYPNLDEDAIGQPIPLAYGKIYSAVPTCIDVSGCLFKVAGHSIRNIEDVRLSTSNSWIQGNIGSLDLPNGQFTLTNWDGESTVVVDFQGKANTDGSLMSNPADIVKNILSYMGQPINEDSFTAGRAEFNIGTVYGSNEENNTWKPSLYISETMDAFEVIRAVLNFTGSYLWADSQGQLYFKNFNPQTREGMNTYSDADIRNFKEETESFQPLSKITANFAIRLKEGWGQTLVGERTSNQYLHGQPVPVLNSIDLPTADGNDAKYAVDRSLYQEGRAAKLYSFTILAPSAFLLTPGSQFHIQYKPKTDGTYYLDAVLEVLGIKLDLVERNVEVLCGDLHQWADHAGYWTDDTTSFPTYLSNEDGYGDGSGELWNPDWSRILKDYARQAWGFWTDDYGFADPTDSESYFPSSWT